MKSMTQTIVLTLLRWQLFSKLSNYSLNYLLQD